MSNINLIGLHLLGGFLRVEIKSVKKQLYLDFGKIFDNDSEERKIVELVVLENKEKKGPTKVKYQLNGVDHIVTLIPLT